MFSSLKGYKTHTVAVLTILYGILGVILGEMEIVQAVEFVFLGLGISALRSGVESKKI